MEFFLGKKRTRLCGRQRVFDRAAVGNPDVYRGVRAAVRAVSGATTRPYGRSAGRRLPGTDGDVVVFITMMIATTMPGYGLVHPSPYRLAASPYTPLLAQELRRGLPAYGQPNHGIISPMTVEEHIQTRAAMLFERLQSAESDRVRRRAWRDLDAIARIANLSPPGRLRKAVATQTSNEVAAAPYSRPWSKYGISPSMALGILNEKENSYAKTNS
jgi:hypothetical protein